MRSAARSRHAQPMWTRVIGLLASLMVILIPGVASASGQGVPARQIASFAAPGCTGQCGSGSTIGPDGALYVTDGPGGRLLRIDRRSGDIRTVTDALPPMIPAVGLGGPIDVAFLGRTPYVLVTLVGPQLGQPGVVAGLYRVNPDGTTRAVVDLGQWSVAHPPATDYMVASGLQYALEPYRDGFLVTDAHLNRVLHVTPRGLVEQERAFGNTAPTGLEVLGSRVLMAEAGPVPHLAETGRVITWHGRQTPRVRAAGAPLPVDVEADDHHRIFVLSQGVWEHENLPENAGLPASPHTGALYRLDSGRLTKVIGGLDRPTSVELVGDDAYVVTLTGTVLRLHLG